MKRNVALSLAVLTMMIGASAVAKTSTPNASASDYYEFCTTGTPFANHVTLQQGQSVGQSSVSMSGPLCMERQGGFGEGSVAAEVPPPGGGVVAYCVISDYASCSSPSGTHNVYAANYASIEAPTYATYRLP